MSHLLLVEDSKRVSEFVKRGLIAEGHSVAVADNAPDGFEIALDQVFDLLVLDIMLPGYSGHELCKRIRSVGDTTPILMLTAIDEVAEKVACLRDGADDYLVKPFDFDELTARVDALVRRSSNHAEQRPAVIAEGDIVFDRRARAVSCNGEKVDLTPREYQLLQILIENPNRPQSRTRLLNKIWGYGCDPLTNVVDVYINRIRKKMRLDADHGPIRALRGYGYCFYTKY
jgi:DNA-binding response OmpR family regulator